MGCQGVQGQKVQECLRHTQNRERSWQLLAYAGFLGAGWHVITHKSSVKFDWLTTRSFRSSFAADTSKVSLRKGGRLVWTLSKSRWYMGDGNVASRSFYGRPISEDVHEQHLSDARNKTSMYARTWTG